MTKEEQKEYHRKYYLENKNKINEHRAKRRNEINEYSRKYYSQKKQRLAELEKENAELVEQLLVVSEQLRFAREMPYSAVKKFAEEKTQEQLTIATEIIKEFVAWANWEGANCPNFQDIQSKAEQFLKGENIILEDVQAGNSPFDADEVFNKEMKAYPEEKVK